MPCKEVTLGLLKLSLPKAIKRFALSIIHLSHCKTSISLSEIFRVTELQNERANPLLNEIYNIYKIYRHLYIIHHLTSKPSSARL